ncbi:FxSxx-COOH system tetratricopeptide repeat protein [Streptomyces sp. NPDC051001]|uniref:FxSxx-COOH system tetratricopeptide repeat protein n=1 Tax=Streptomyces sp. NPDC051001 TaxID=3155795 RepID=UPI0034306620
MEQRVFISYAGIDRAWAEWVAWQLTDAGCSTFLDVRDVAVGENFLTRIERELATADAIVVLLSAGRATSSFAAAEIRAGVPLVPVRLDDTPVPAELGAVQTVDFVGADETEARNRLVQAVLGVRSGQGHSPAGHLTGERRLRRLGLAGPRLPGRLPRIWNLPPRNPHFTGRDDELARLRVALLDGSPVQSILGMGGVGKTQLALEYAYRFAGEYELAWWVHASRPRAIAKELAELAVRAGAATADSPPARAWEALREDLRTRSRWLLVLDGAGAPDELGRWLPEGVGHVLVTSREPGWSDSVTAFEVGVFERAEAVALLRSRVPSLTQSDGDELAHALGDFPLALAQAAATLEEGIDVRTYLRLLNKTSGALADDTGEEPGTRYPRPLAAAVGLAVENLRREGPEGATDLLFGAALLGPAPLPLAPDLPAIFRSTPDTAPPEMLRVLQAYGLVRVLDGALHLHRLTQSILRDLLSEADRASASRAAEALLLSVTPGSHERAAPERWRAVLPHLLVVEPRDLTTERGRAALIDACFVVLEQGDPATASERLDQLRRAWTDELGPDHPLTLTTLSYRAEALWRLDEADAALLLLEELLERLRHSQGEDDAETLVTAARIALQLSYLDRYTPARALGEDTLTRMRRVLGEDHHATLSAASNLAMVLAHLGETEAALQLGEEVLVRRRRVLGGDHPDALNSAYNLALVRASTGDTETARDLMEDVLVRRRRVLGEDHLDALAAADLLARLLGDLTEWDAALSLATDTAERARRTFGDDDPRTRESVELLVRCLEHSEGAQQPEATPPSATAPVTQDPLFHRQWRPLLPSPERDAVRGVAPSGDISTAPSDVVISYAPADESWARWVAWNLEQWDRRAELSPLPSDHSRPSDITIKEDGVVVALFSPAYVDAAGPWTESEGTRLALLQALDRGAFVPLFVEPVPAQRLPSALRPRSTPTLEGLDETAARDLLRYTLSRPERLAPEGDFPGSVGESGERGGNVLRMQLVDALLNSVVGMERDARMLWLDTANSLLGGRLHAAVPEHGSPRLQIYSIVRAALRLPNDGGLRALTDALEIVEGSSSALREVRRVAGRIEQRQDVR